MMSLHGENKAKTMWSGLLRANRRIDLERSVHVSLKHQYVYFSVSKAANSTVKRLLQQKEIEDTKFELGHVHDRLSSPLLAPFQIPDHWFEEIFGGSSFFKFAVVRNPYTRILSAYLDRASDSRSGLYKRLIFQMGLRQGDDIPFGDYVRLLGTLDDRQLDVHVRPQSALLNLDFLYFDSIYKFESFPETLRSIGERVFKDKNFGLHSQNYSPSITAADEKKVTYYSPALADIIRERYWKDFEMLGYV